MSRYSVEKFRFKVGGEVVVEFSADQLSYLPSPEQAGAEPGTALYEVLAAVQDANSPGFVVEFSDAHAEAIAPQFEAFTHSLRGLQTKMDHRERKLVQVVNASSN